MINKTILRVGSAVALAFGLFACNNDTITNLNKNPNNPEDVPPGPLFTEASRLATTRWFGGIDLRTYEWAVQQLSEVQYNDEDATSVCTRLTRKALSTALTPAS